MTHLSSYFSGISPSHLSPPKLLSYILILLICLGCAGSSSRDAQTVSIADLRAQLQPLKRIGVYAGFDIKSHVLYMGNDLMERWLHLDQGAHKVATIRYAHKASGQSYIDRPSEEFRFRIGEIVFSGDSDLLTYNDYQIVQKMGGGKRITIQFTYTSDEEVEPIFYLWVHYEIYPDLPGVHKWLTIQNLTDSAFFVEDVTIESLPLFVGRRDSLQIWRCGVSGVVEGALTTPWKGGTSEAFILVGDAGVDSGVVLGNESAGILKHYGVYSDRETVSISLGAMPATNRTEIRAPSGQAVDSPKVWTMLVEGGLQATIERIDRDPMAYMSRYSKGAELQTPEIHWIAPKPEWETLIESMRPGDLIVLDYDWNMADLQTAKRISQRVHEGGGKFGIRLPIAEIPATVLDHPEWRLAPAPVVQWKTVPESSDAEQEGEPAEEQIQQPTSHKEVPEVYCVLSDYGYHLTQAVRAVLEETAADTLILDRPILGSEDSLLKGCNALGHQHYTRAESIGVIYRWLFEFADHLRREYPALQLGITASAYGVEQPDTACLTHFDLFFEDLEVDLQSSQQGGISWKERR